MNKTPYTILFYNYVYKGRTNKCIEMLKTRINIGKIKDGYILTYFVNNSLTNQVSPPYVEVCKTI